MPTAIPLSFQFTADSDVAPAVLEEYRRALEIELGKLPGIQAVETAETRAMGDGTILGIIADVTLILKDGALAAAALTTFLVSVRKVAKELGVWREVFIEPKGRRKMRLKEGSEAKIAATVQPAQSTTKPRRRGRDVERRR